jgi:hypothetical protein
MVTRREMVLTSVASAVAGGQRGDASALLDPQVALARYCLECTSEIETLWEAHEREFARLTALLGKERVHEEWNRSTPRTRRLSEIPARIDELDRKRQQITEHLAHEPALSLEGVAGKISIAHELIDPRDDPYETRALLARAAADLAAFGIAVRS